MTEPGDATEEAKALELEKLRQAAAQSWGSERAEAIEPALVKAAASIARLDLLQFSRDDAPAFYLHETEPENPRD